METGKALDIVHAMAWQFYKNQGEISTLSGSPADTEDALNTVADLIVNNFGVETAEPIKVKFQIWDCELRFRTYGNGRTAIELVDTNSDCSGEPVAIATVNVPEIELGEDEVLIKDYSENKGMLATLVGAGVVEATGREVGSGLVKLPVCKLLVKKEDR